MEFFFTLVFRLATKWFSVDTFFFSVEIEKKKSLRRLTFSFYTVNFSFTFGLKKNPLKSPLILLRRTLTGDFYDFCFSCTTFFLFLKGCKLSVLKSNSSSLIVYNSFCRQLDHIACGALKLVESCLFVLLGLVWVGLFFLEMFRF